jgi:RNA recognition motif-containing protein
MAAPAANDDPLTLFVGGVPFAATDADITSWFVSHGLKAGSVKNVDLPVHADSQRKKGFAVVKFDSAASVQAAIKLDHADMNGRYLNIRPYLTEPPAHPERAPKPKKERAPKPAADANAAGGAVGSGEKKKKKRKPKAKKAANADGSAPAAASSSARPPRPAREPRAPFVAPAGWKIVFVGNLPWSATEEEIAGLLANGAGCTVRLGWDNVRDRAKGFAHIDFETAEAAQAAVNQSGVELGGRALRINFAPEKVEPEAKADA